MVTRTDMLAALADAIAAGRAVWVPARGLSMGPWFARADEVRVEKPAPAPVRPGALVVFRRGEQWIAHRVIGRRRAEDAVVYRTMGDGERAADEPPVRSSDCIGVVTAVRAAGVEISLGSFRARWQAVRMVVIGRLIVFVRRR